MIDGALERQPPANESSAKNPRPRGLEYGCCGLLADSLLKLKRPSTEDQSDTRSPTAPILWGPLGPSTFASLLGGLLRGPLLRGRGPLGAPPLGCSCVGLNNQPEGHREKSLQDPLTPANAVVTWSWAASIGEISAVEASDASAAVAASAPAAASAASAAAAAPPPAGADAAAAFRLGVRLTLSSIRDGLKAEVSWPFSGAPSAPVGPPQSRLDKACIKAALKAERGSSFHCTGSSSSKKNFSSKRGSRSSSKGGTGSRRRKRRRVSAKRRAAGAAACRAPVRVSAELQQLLLLPPVSSRIDVVRGLWAYVKQQHLQQEGAPHTIRCDPPLQRLFGGLHSVNLFRDINTLLLPHLIYDTDAAAADAAAADAAAADAAAADAAAGGAQRKKQVKGEEGDSSQMIAAGAAGRQGRVKYSSCSSSSSSSSRSSSCSNSSSSDDSDCPSERAAALVKRPSRRRSSSSSSDSSSSSSSKSNSADPSEALPHRGINSSRSSSSAGRQQTPVNAALGASAAARAPAASPAAAAAAAATATAADASGRPRLRRLLLSSSDEENDGTWAPLLPPRDRAAATPTAAARSAAAATAADTAAVTLEAGAPAARAAREAAGLAKRTKEPGRCSPRVSLKEEERTKEQQQSRQQLQQQQQQQQQQEEQKQQQEGGRQQQQQRERRAPVGAQEETEAAAEDAAAAASAETSHLDAWGRWVDEGDDPMLLILQAAETNQQQQQQQVQQQQQQVQQQQQQLLQHQQLRLVLRNQRKRSVSVFVCCPVCRRVGEAFLKGRLTFQLLLQQLPAAAAAAAAVNAAADGAAAGRDGETSSSKSPSKPYDLRFEGALNLAGLDPKTPYKLTLRARMQQQQHQQQQQQQQQQRQNNPLLLVKSEVVPTAAAAGPANDAAASTPAATAAAAAAEATAATLVVGSAVLEQRLQIEAWSSEACQAFARGLSLPPLAAAFEAWDVQGPVLLQLGPSELSTLGIRPSSKIVDTSSSSSSSSSSCCFVAASTAAAAEGKNSNIFRNLRNIEAKRGPSHRTTNGGFRGGPGLGAPKSFEAMSIKRAAATSPSQADVGGKRRIVEGGTTRVSFPGFYIEASLHGDKGARRQMEDEHLVLPALSELEPSLKPLRDFAVFAIFDGHGGRQSAAFVKAALPSEIATQLKLYLEQQQQEEGQQQQQKQQEAQQKVKSEAEAEAASSSSNGSSSSSNSNGSLKSSNNASSSDSRPTNGRVSDHEMRKHLLLLLLLQGLLLLLLLLLRLLLLLQVLVYGTELSMCRDGCTAVLLMILGKQAFIAGLGDSAAYLARRHATGHYAIPLTEMHRPYLLGEKERILRMGGSIEGGRVNGSLEITRSASA
ncbi:hypothetical protein Emag_002099 [Eimeria magna]